MEKQAAKQSKEKIDKVTKTDADWRQQLSDEEYQGNAQERHRAGVLGQILEYREARRFRVRLLRRAAVRFVDQIRFRHGLAELLGSAG